MTRRVAYVATAICALGWGAAEFFAVRFSDMIWGLLSWATKGSAPLPAAIVILLTIPPLGFATALCLSLSAISRGNVAAPVKIAAVSSVVCALFISAILWVENSK